MGNLHLVTGYAGAPHVSSSDQGSLYEALIRGGQFVLDAGAKFSASIVSNNQVRVNDGELMMQGRHVKLTPGAYVDLTVDNGTQGYSRTDLIVARYTKAADTGIEECSLVVIKGTPAGSKPSDPEYTTGIINAEGALQHDFPLYRVSISGLVLEGLTGLFEPEESLFDYVNKNFAPAGYGLGTMGRICEDCNTAINGGFYALSGDSCLNSPSSYKFMKYGSMLVLNRYNGLIVQVVFYRKYIAIRHSDDGGNAWAEWECLNPPLLEGVEYRTTDRYNGAAIYKKIDSSGDILWRIDGETKWRLLTSASYVATATVE